MTNPQILLAIALASSSPAQSGEVTDTERAMAVEALKLAYILNGNSMVRWGSVDMSRSFVRPCTNCSPIPEQKPAR